MRIPLTDRTPRSARYDRARLLDRGSPQLQQLPHRQLQQMGTTGASTSPGRAQHLRRRRHPSRTGLRCASNRSVGDFPDNGVPGRSAVAPWSTLWPAAFPRVAGQSLFVGPPNRGRRGAPARSTCGKCSDLVGAADTDVDGRICLAEYQAAFAAGLLVTPASFDAGYVPFLTRSSHPRRPRTAAAPAIPACGSVSAMVTSSAKGKPPHGTSASASRSSTVRPWSTVHTRRSSKSPSKGTALKRCFPPSTPVPTRTQRGPVAPWESGCG